MRLAPGKRPLLYYWLPLVSWMVVIFVVSAQPALPHAPQGWLDTLLKKLAHMAEYAILTVLWCRALGRGEKWRWGRVLLACALTLLYAASDEYHQTFVPNRKGRLSDVVVDNVGAGVGVLVYYFVKRKM
jgi:VanZ family protein